MTVTERSVDCSWSHRVGVTVRTHTQNGHLVRENLAPVGSSQIIADTFDQDGMSSEVT